MTTYAISELLRLRIFKHSIGKDVLNRCRDLGCLSRPKYLHRGSRRVQKNNNFPLPVIVGNTARLRKPLPIAKRGVDLSNLRPLQNHDHSPVSSQNIIPVKLVLLNTQSLTNKSLLFYDYLMDCNTDILCLTETWHRHGAYHTLNETCPPGYTYIEKARCSGRGGGLAVLYRVDLKISLLSLPSVPCVFI